MGSVPRFPKDKSAPKYAEALAIIEAGKEMLAGRPREDMPSFQILGKDAEREARYQERAKIEADVRRAILAGEKVYPYKPTLPVARSGE